MPDSKRRLHPVIVFVSVFAYVFLGGTSAWTQAEQPDLSKMSLEDLVKVQVDSVSGASKFLEKSTDVPASTTIVTADEIREFGYRTLADVLQAVRGFYVDYDRNYSYVGSRGFMMPGDYNSRILFLLDGHRINDNLYDGAYVGTAFPVDVNLIDRVEIVRGASSSVWGPGALLAVINIITKRGRDLNAAEIDGTAGSLRTYKGQAAYGTRFDNGLEMLFSGTDYRSHGNASLFFPEFDSPQTNFGLAENADGDRAAGFFGNVIYRNFDIHVVDSSRTKQIPTASFGTVFNDPRTQTTDSHGYVDVQYTRNLGSWEILARASYDWYHYHGVYIYDYSGLGIPPYTQNEDIGDGTWADLEFDASRRFERHHLTVGTEYIQDFREQQSNYDLSPYFLYLNETHPGRAVGVYAQDEYRIWSGLSLVGGVRFDWHEDLAKNESPRLGLVYSPEAATHVKLMYGTAFRLPNAYEAYYVSSISNTATATLKPEQVDTLEFEVEHNFANRYDLIASVYGNRFHNLIDVESNPAIGQVPNANSPDVLHSNGVELEIDANWPHAIQGQLSYSLQGSRYFRVGLPAANSPAQLAKARLLLPIVQKRLSLGLNGWFTDRMLTFTGAELGGYFLANATLLAQNLRKNLDLSLSVYNLLNKYYADPPGFEHREASIPQDGRTAQVEFTY
jgi:outer membrane receptor for ferrienterochelin and colicins